MVGVISQLVALCIVIVTVLMIHRWLYFLPRSAGGLIISVEAQLRSASRPVGQCTACRCAPYGVTEGITPAGCEMICLP